MRKPSTGEPCAGKPHARFGGRGGLTAFPTPIEIDLFSVSLIALDCLQSKYSDNSWCLMRLTDHQIESIRATVAEVFGADAEVWLFGSRVDDQQREIGRAHV